MKIKYEFATETVEIEVTDAWGATIVDLERQEYNIDNKETRRHCSMDANNLDDTHLSERKKTMRHNLKISVSKNYQSAPHSTATSPPTIRTPATICAETI